MTGGEPSSLVGREVELLRPDGSPWCRLPPLPAARFAHTQTGLVTCGSGEYHHQEAQTSCISFTGGTWAPSHHLVQPRCRAQPLQSTAPCTPTQVAPHLLGLSCGRGAAGRLR